MFLDGPRRSIKMFNLAALIVPTASIVQLVTQYHEQLGEEKIDIYALKRFSFAVLSPLFLTKIAKI